jgi:capsular exopolysaccharide synthesis family protein
VASSGPAEGKSTVAANLAVVMAQAGNRVILLDGDLRRPSLHHVFNVPNTFGLSHLAIRHGVKLDGALTPTPVPGLSLITTGPLPPNPAELLASAKMTSLLDEMSHHADVVIIDSPPVSAVTDAAVLSGKVDGVVIVINAAETRMAPAVHTKEQLERAGAAVMGVAMNRVSAHLGGYYYYYNYHYYDDGKKSRANGHERRPFGLLGSRKRAVASDEIPVAAPKPEPPSEYSDSPNTG